MTIRKTVPEYQVDVALSEAMKKHKVWCELGMECHVYQIIMQVTKELFTDSCTHDMATCTHEQKTKGDDES